MEQRVLHDVLMSKLHLLCVNVDVLNVNDYVHVQVLSELINPYMLQYFIKDIIHLGC